MIKDILFVIWFFLPAGLANMAPIFAAKLPALRRLNFPLDCYFTFRGKRIFGSHKTVRGFISGVIVGILTVYLQVFLYTTVPLLKTFISVNYNTINPMLLGLLASSGALAGDAVRSFFKRQMDIAPGKSWFPFDQIDYVIGGIVLTACYIRLTILQYLLLFVIWFFIHPLATLVGYWLKLKNSPI
jgi:CDP-2,3-bis-(O-geranylgeranyl)-sn-glycerol synthase